MKKKAVRCKNADVHADEGGHILVIFEKNAFYMQCKNSQCKRWTRLEISFPHTEIDFRDAAIVQSLMPTGYHFDVEPAAAAIGG